MRNFRYFICIVALSSLFTQSCKDYLDINDNPNQAVSSTPELVLTTALNRSASQLNHHEIGAFWGGQWAPSGSVSGFNQEKTYDITSTFRTGIWSNTYDILLDLKYVEEKASEQKKLALVGISKVMKAYNFQVIVDTYNNAPYTEALKGTKAIRPKYEEGSVIYDSLVAGLNLAVEYLQAPFSGDNPNPGANDIYLQGDTKKWVKLANTLKLRLLLRQINIPSKQAYIAEEIAKIPTGSDSYLAVGEDVLSNPGYLKSAGKLNPFYESYGFTSADALAGNHDFYCYSKFFIDFLQSTNDTRIDRLATKGSGGGFLGVPFGEGSEAYLYAKVSGFGPAFMPATAAAAGASDLYKRSQVVMSAAESFFLQAEAVQRGLLPGNAQSLYESGIKESFRLLGVTNSATAAATYYGQTLKNTGWTASPNKIEAIITQKWVALVNTGSFEAWTEYRRTGYPSGIPLSTKAASSIKPIRLLYPQSEYNNNDENATAQGSISQFTSKIFWMN